MSVSDPSQPQGPTAEVLAGLPHRPPFLFVDRVVERAEGRLVTEWDVDPEADFFRGHYPGFPLLPGALAAESCFQTGALLCAGDPRDAGQPGEVPVLTRIEDARYKHMVRPGETLTVEVVLDERLGAARWMTGRVSSRGRVVLRVRFVVALAPAPALPGPEAPLSEGRPNEAST